MDFGKLAKVADSISKGKGKQNVPASGRQVADEKNPLDALEDREKITDQSQKTIIIDDVFIRKLADATRDQRRKFLSRLTDSQRRRVLVSLKRIKDSGASERLGYVLLDDLLANVAFDPTKESVKNLNDFVESQNYFEMSDNMKVLVEQVLSGSVDLDKKALEELKSGLGERESHLIANIGEQDDFEIPEEEELTEEDINSLEDSAKQHVALFKQNKNFREVNDAADEVISVFQGKNRNYAKTSNAYWGAFEKAWKEQFEGEDVFKTLNSKEMSDSLEAALDVIQDETSKLDEVFEKPAIDNNGEEVKDVEEESILSLLSEALSDFVSGSPEKLQTLANQNLSTEVPSEETEEVTLEEEPDEEPEVEIKEDAEDEAFTDSAIHLARRVLKGKRVNKLVDSLESKVETLKKVNFRKTDCVLPCNEVAQTQAINMPLSCEEYNTLCPPRITPLMEELLMENKESGAMKALPPIESCVVNEQGLIDVNEGQIYVPLCPIDEFENRIKEAENNEAIHEIVSSCAVSVEDALAAAAKCDNLSFIDTRFYKPSVGSSAWSFDEENKPACLIECPEGNKIERCCKDKANYSLYGVPYYVS